MLERERISHSNSSLQAAIATAFEVAEHTSSPGYPMVQSNSRCVQVYARPPPPLANLPSPANSMQTSFTTHSSTLSQNNGPTTTCLAIRYTFDLATRQQHKKPKNAIKSSADIRFVRNLGSATPQVTFLDSTDFKRV